MTINLTTKTNLRYSFDLNYDTGYPGCCGCGRCDCEYDCFDYCRCGQIETYSMKIESFTHTDALNFINSKSDSDDVTKYLEILWLKNQKFDVDTHLDCVVIGGYYGEELEAVYPTLEFISLVDGFNKLTMVEKFHAALTAEYGFVHDKLLNKTKFEFISVPVKNVHAEKSVLNKCNKSLVSYYAGSIQFKRRPYLYDPLCVETDVPGEYKVIDGHHRFSAIVTGSRGSKKKKKVIRTVRIFLAS